jgi:hypothetical protein
MRRPASTSHELLLGDGPLREAARMMGVTLKDFGKLLPDWRKKDFPGPIP